MIYLIAHARLFPSQLAGQKNEHRINDELELIRSEVVLLRFSLVQFEEFYLIVDNDCCSYIWPSNWKHSQHIPLKVATNPILILKFKHVSQRDFDNFFIKVHGSKRF